MRMVAEDVIFLWWQVDLLVQLDGEIIPKVLPEGRVLEFGDGTTPPVSWGLLVHEKNPKKVREDEGPNDEPQRGKEEGSENQKESDPDATCLEEKKEQNGEGLLPSGEGNIQRGHTNVHVF